MNTHTTKKQEATGQAVANNLTKQQSIHTGTFQLVNNRPETIVQRELQEMANNSPQVKQLRDMQAMVDGRTLNTVQRKEINNPKEAHKHFEPAQKSTSPEVVQRYIIQQPSAVQKGTKFDSQSIKKGAYSRAYQKSSLVSGEEGFVLTSKETQTEVETVVPGALPQMKISAGKRMAIHHTEAQPKEFFAESTLVDESNTLLKKNASTVRLKKGSKTINVTGNVNPLVRVSPAVEVPVDVDHADGLNEMITYPQHKCNEFIRQVVTDSERVISLLPKEEEANVEIPTGLMGEPVEILMNYLAVTPTETVSAEGLKNHSRFLNQRKDYSYEQTAPAAYSAISDEEKSAKAKKLGLNEFALPEVGEGYVIASRVSPEIMGGLRSKLNPGRYLEAIQQLEELDPALDATKQEMDDNVVLGMMKIWGSHYAGVVAKDGVDTVTYENYNRTTELEWEVRDIFNKLFIDFAAFRGYVAEQTEELNLNLGIEQAEEYINGAHEIVKNMVTVAHSQQEKYKLAIAQAKQSINVSLKSDTPLMESLIYFQMYGPAEQSFHATYKGMTANPTTMRIAPSVEIIVKEGKELLKKTDKKYESVLPNPHPQAPWAEIHNAFGAQADNWYRNSKRIIDAAVDYKSVKDVVSTMESGFQAWNNNLRIAIVNKVKQIVGNDTLPAPASKDDVLQTINNQVTLHNYSSFDFSTEGYRKAGIYTKLNILLEAAKHVQ